MAEWIEKAAPVAYGPLGLKPWEFGRLTFGEFYALAEGYHWRTRQEQVQTAGFVASIINTCTPRDLKKAVTVDMLLGRERQEKPKVTQDEARTDIKELLASVG
ncbi:MAG: hypothetical protein N3A66_06795 [Planctomycetota bacterium]|nr:hypothetical protein [Planctomycetota bacterium]